ncbi:MAG: cytidylyltransferase domain-containing protein [Flavobacteriales bacterium]
MTVSPSDFHIVIQTRIGSTRLPGKVLLPFFNEQTMLDIILEELKQLNLPITIATSEQEENLILKETALKHDCSIFFGSENDVLNRFISCSESKYIIRICSDNPFIQVEYIKDLLLLQEKDPNQDYYSFKDNKGTPVIKTHFGFFTELVKREALVKAENMTNNPLYKEHVTNYIYENNDVFKVKLKPLPLVLKNSSNIRLTVDDIQDFELAKKLYHKYIINEKNFDQLIEYIVSNNEMQLLMKKNILKYSKA